VVGAGALAGCILLSPWFDLGRDRRAIPDLVRREVLLSPGWLDACARVRRPVHLGRPIGLAAVRRPRRASAAADPGRYWRAARPDAELLAASASAARVDVT